MEILERYPFNLGYTIFEDERKALELYVPGILNAVRELRENEQAWIKLRYEEGLCDKECAKVQGMTKDHLNKVKERTIRKLRNSPHIDEFMAVPKAKYKESLNKWENLSKEYNTVSEAYKEATKNSKRSQKVVVEAERLEILQTPLEKLDLSNRTFNSLRRHGICNVRGITELTEAELMTVRCLGVKCREEVKELLRENGLSLKDSRK